MEFLEAFEDPEVVKRYEETTYNEFFDAYAEGKLDEKLEDMGYDKSKLGEIKKEEEIESHSDNWEEVE